MKYLKKPTKFWYEDNHIYLPSYFPTYLDYISTSTNMEVSTKSRNPLIFWSVDHVANEKHYIFTSTKSAASDERMLFTKSHNTLVMWTYQVIWQIKNVTSRPVGAKFDGMVDYDKEPQTTKSHFLSFTWSRKVTWKIKNVFLIQRDLWSPDLTGWWPVRRGCYPQWPHDSIITW